MAIGFYPVPNSRSSSVPVIVIVLVDPFSRIMVTRCVAGFTLNRVRLRRTSIAQTSEVRLAMNERNRIKTMIMVITAPSSAPISPTAYGGLIHPYESGRELRMELREDSGQSWPLSGAMSYIIGFC